MDHVSACTSYSLLGVVDIRYALDRGKAIQRDQHNEEVHQNREMLRHHIDITILLAQQGMAFRGHDESPNSINSGNFIEMMQLLSKYSGNKLLQQALGGRTVFSGLSADIQNDLILSIYEIVMREIKQRVANASYVSIMADESTDNGNCSQFCAVVRLVHEGSVYEHVFDLCDVSSDHTALHLSDTLVGSLNSKLVSTK